MNFGDVTLIRHKTFALAVALWIALARAGSGQPMSLSSAKAMEISAPRVEYPHEARAKGITGSGLYELHVNPRGLVS